MRVIIEKDAKNVGIWAAHYIADKINAHAAKTDKPFVLGLPTGGTPLTTYAELVKLNKAGEVSFANVITFNMSSMLVFPRVTPRATTRLCGATSSTTSTSRRRT